MKISGITYAPRKTRKIKYYVILSSTLVMSVILIIMLVSIYVGWSLTHPKKMDIPAFSANIVPEYKDATFLDTSGKVTLRGWLFETKGSDKTIILAHGYKQNRLEFGEHTLDLIKSCLNKGYNFLAFDFRNCGLSGGTLTSVGEYEKYDLLGAIKYAKAHGSKHIILLGYSMGASTSILAASESKDIDAVIADSPFANLDDYLNKELPVWSKLPAVPFNKTILFSMKALTGVDPGKVSPKDIIAKMAPTPLLLIHSKDDKQVSVDNSKKLYDIYSKVVGTKAEFWETSGVDHVGSYEKSPIEYMNRIFDFLDKVYTKSK